MERREISEDGVCKDEECASSRRLNGFKKPDSVNESHVITIRDGKSLEDFLKNIKYSHLGGEPCKSLVSQISELNISQSAIQTLPASLCDLRSLCVLNLDNNGLSDFPLVICELKNLVVLKMSCTGVSMIPDEIENLVNLKMLDISRNNFTILPDVLGNLRNLFSLNVSENKLSDLPSTIPKLKGLKRLNLSNNKFTEVPLPLLSMQNISCLNLSNNMLSSFDWTLSCYLKLCRIDLSYNALHHVPMWLFEDYCFFLSYVDLSHNFNMIIDKLLVRQNAMKYQVHTQSLLYLNISDCGVSSDSLYLLRRFSNLRILNIGNAERNGRGRNFFWEIPSNTLTSNIALSELMINNVQLSLFPEGVTKLLFIETLDLSGNLISWLPDSILNMNTLKRLRLSKNELIELPAQFGYLKNLEELRLNGNKICSLPPSFCNLKKLQILDLYDNNLDVFPVELKLLTCLKSLDLEQNFFDCTETGLSHIDFDLLEWYNNLRKDFQKSDFGCMDRAVSRKCPPNYENNDVDDDPEDSVSMSVGNTTDLEDEGCNHNFEGHDENISYISTHSVKDDECWDDSDSDDFFVPAPKGVSVYRMASQGTWNPVCVMSDKFYASDLHYTSLIKWKQTWVAVEGQFDDEG